MLVSKLIHSLNIFIPETFTKNLVCAGPRGQDKSSDVVGKVLVRQSVRTSFFYSMKQQASNMFLTLLILELYI